VPRKPYCAHRGCYLGRRKLVLAAYCGISITTYPSRVPGACQRGATLHPCIVPDAILDQRRAKWITKIVDSSSIARWFFSPRTLLPGYDAEHRINIPAGSSREDATFGPSCARRLEKKGSDRWVERTKRFSASKCPKHYGSSRSIGIKLALSCPVALSGRWRQSASVRAFSPKPALHGVPLDPKAARCPRRHCASPCRPSTTCDRRLVAHGRPPSDAFRQNRPP